MELVVVGFVWGLWGDIVVCCVSLGDAATRSTREGTLGDGFAPKGLLRGSCLSLERLVFIINGIGCLWKWKWLFVEMELVFCGMELAACFGICCLFLGWNYARQGSYSTESEDRIPRVLARVLSVTLSHSQHFRNHATTILMRGKLTHDVDPDVVEFATKSPRPASCSLHLPEIIFVDYL